MKAAAIATLALAVLVGCGVDESEELIVDVAAFARNPGDEAHEAGLRAKAIRLGLESRAVTILLANLDGRLPEFRGEWWESPVWDMDAEARRVMGFCTSLGVDSVDPVLKFLRDHCGSFDAGQAGLTRVAERRDPGAVPLDPLSLGHWGAAEAKILMSLISEYARDPMYGKSVEWRSTTLSEKNVLLALYAIGLLSPEGQDMVVNECAVLLLDETRDHKIWGLCQEALMRVGPEGLERMASLLRTVPDSAVGWVARPFVAFALSPDEPNALQKVDKSALALAEEIALSGGAGSWTMATALLRLDGESIAGCSAVRTALLGGDRAHFEYVVQDLFMSDLMRTSAGVRAVVDELLASRALSSWRRGYLKREIDISK